MKKMLHTRGATWSGFINGNFVSMSKLLNVLRELLYRDNELRVANNRGDWHVAWRDQDL